MPCCASTGGSQSGRWMRWYQDARLAARRGTILVSSVRLVLVVIGRSPALFAVDKTNPREAKFVLRSTSVHVIHKVLKKLCFELNGLLCILTSKGRHTSPVLSKSFPVIFSQLCFLCLIIVRQQLVQLRFTSQPQG
ncbi:hypothetical protein JI435_305430 [Parastagonospora nodorum SN15]|uniref:Uncharacterized protein n=1 Tax=Phaeosphaeria nodorum (strain SN15 / ATCC MYA-4574 / FGSC 10173) TaxID=321614 RepID=A0A7U2HXK3_PHANO|nr:hypothetical protein JI435_305430 [Parastagonospora nodorum SN15]